MEQMRARKKKMARSARYVKSDVVRQAFLCVPCHSVPPLRSPQPSPRPRKPSQPQRPRKARRPLKRPWKKRRSRSVEAEHNNHAFLRHGHHQIGLELSDFFSSFIFLLSSPVISPPSLIRYRWFLFSDLSPLVPCYILRVPLI